MNKNDFKSNFNKEEKAVEDLFMKTHFREKTGRFMAGHTTHVKRLRVIIFTNIIKRQ